LGGLCEVCSGDAGNKGQACCKRHSIEKIAHPHLGAIHGIGDSTGAPNPESPPADSGEVISVNVVGKNVFLPLQGGRACANTLKGKAVLRSNTRNPQYMETKCPPDTFSIQASKGAGLLRSTGRGLSDDPSGMVTIDARGADIDATGLMGRGASRPQGGCQRATSKIATRMLLRRWNQNNEVRAAGHESAAVARPVQVPAATARGADKGGTARLSVLVRDTLSHVTKTHEGDSGATKASGEGPHVASPR